jgi:hypothetical protein
MHDAWGWWLKFERQHGMGAQQEDVIVRCQAAEPSHGETWQPIAKDDKNGGKSAKEILELVVATFALNMLSCSTCEYILFQNHIAAV